ncbi:MULTISPECIES: dockerin type I domain-containing protein [Paenibacillus]|uniref:dockerin type I domain-containing protein n=1 Tax=Paenibacillus TaxID=44249 RepID=UPI0022B86F75|nr:dockerin type I domain-containing protein [Paenibacillus caseinilyticus]MCZ8522981.1 dockerin type I domain-containing protein [Paenibacillus caseinilyticus]
MLPEPAAPLLLHIVTADLDGDGAVTLTDLERVSLASGTAAGDAGYDASMDFNLDGRIDVLDVQYVKNKLTTAAPAADISAAAAPL